jgi:hypothetical protein
MTMRPYFSEPGIELYHASAARLPLADGSVQMCATSPPFWGLRCYGTDAQVWGGDEACAHRWGEQVEQHDEREAALSGKTRTTERFYGDPSRKFNGNHQKHVSGATCTLCGAWRGELGNEPTPDLYVSHLVAVFREVRRVLKDDGVLFLNLGDSYASDTKSGGSTGGKHVAALHDAPIGRGKRETGLKAKDLVCIPWRVAMALQADGWWLRSGCPWVKRNAMPESVTDRPATALEYVFLLSKSESYFYDHEAVKRSCASGPSDIRKMLEQKPRIGGKNKDPD